MLFLLVQLEELEGSPRDLVFDDCIETSDIANFSFCSTCANSVLLILLPLLAVLADEFDRDFDDLEVVEFDLVLDDEEDGLGTFCEPW